MILIKRTAALLLICCFVFSNVELVSSKAKLPRCLKRLFGCYLHDDYKDRREIPSSAAPPSYSSTHDSQSKRIPLPPIPRVLSDSEKEYEGNDAPKNMVPPQSRRPVAQQPISKIKLPSGTEVGVYSDKNMRDYMEDRHFIETNIEEKGFSLYAIFDGHGGEDTAERALIDLIPPLKTNVVSVKEYLESPWEKKPGESHHPSKYIDSNNQIDYNLILSENISLFERRYLQRARKKIINTTGTTAIIAVMDEQTLFVANVGDSRGVMCDFEDKVIPLSEDHKPDSETEKKRIEEANGVINRDKNNTPYIDGIAVSRSLGDRQIKLKNRVIAIPDIKEFPLSQYVPKFLIFGCDGLWDVFDNNEAVRFVLNLLNKGNRNATDIAQKIVQEAETMGSEDNITVIISIFPV